MIILILICLGLCFGSFINALVWRVHEQSKPKKKRAASDERLSIAHGRSMCTHCKHELGVADLMPLFSWLWLRGKCRYCGHKIDDSPWVEAILPAAFVLSYLYWPYGFGTLGTISFVLWLVALVGLLALAVYDLRWMLLPNRIVYPLMAVGAANFIVHLALGGTVGHMLVSGVSSVAIAGGLFFVLYYASKGAWIGGGDINLGFVIGLLLIDPGLSLLMLFVASFIGTILALPQVLLGRLDRKSHIPFGPLLILATFVVQLFGSDIINWYTHTLLGL